MNNYYQWSKDLQMFEIEHSQRYDFELLLTTHDNLCLKHIKKRVNNDVESELWRILNASF